MVLSSRDTSVLLLLLMCFSFTFVGVNSSSGKLPPPENLTLSWDPISHLSVTAHWKEPAGLDSKCKVNYSVAIYCEVKTCPPKNYMKQKFTELRTERLSITREIPKEVEICVGITTNPMVCGQKYASVEIYRNLSPPLAIVRNFSCAYYDVNKMNCTWTIVNNTPNLQLFYRIENNNKDTLKHCGSYVTDGAGKTGCHLYDKELMANNKVSFVINGGGENRLINKFTVDIQRSAVKLPKPKVIVTQENESLCFQASTPADFLQPQCLKYKFTYIKCNEKVETTETTETTTNVPYDSACRYTVRAQVIYVSTCGDNKDIKSDMSEPVYYGEDGDPNLAFKVAMIITPLILCFCLVTAIVLFRRNKDIILPKIPDPSLFFKDMLSTSDGLSRSLGGGTLYVPVMEDVASGVSLEPKPLILPPNHDTCI